MMLGEVVSSRPKAAVEIWVPGSVDCQQTGEQSDEALQPLWPRMEATRRVQSTIL